MRSLGASISLGIACTVLISCGNPERDSTVALWRLKSNDLAKKLDEVSRATPAGMLVANPDSVVTDSSLALHEQIENALSRQSLVLATIASDLKRTNASRDTLLRAEDNDALGAAFEKANALYEVDMNALGQIEGQRGAFQSLAATTLQRKTIDSSLNESTSKPGAF